MVLICVRLNLKTCFTDSLLVQFWKYCCCLLLKSFVSFLWVCVHRLCKGWPNMIFFSIFNVYRLWWLRCRKKCKCIIIGTFTIFPYGWFCVQYSTVLSLFYLCKGSPVINEAPCLFGQGWGVTSDWNHWAPFVAMLGIYQNCVLFFLFL